MKKTFIISLAVIAISVACSTSKSTTKVETTETVSDEAALVYAKSQWSDVTNEQLQQGKVIAENQCASCHKQKPIPSYTVEHWEKMIKVMAPKAKLVDSETEALRRYILTQKGIETK